MDTSLAVKHIFPGALEETASIFPSAVDVGQKWMMLQRLEEPSDTDRHGDRDESRSFSIGWRCLSTVDEAR